MDAQTAQLRHQIDATRAALDAKVTQLEQRVSQLPAALLEQHVLRPVRGVQDTAARATTLLSQSPWLILAAGALLGAQLRRGKTRPLGPVSTPPPRAAVTPPRAPPPARVRPTVYEAPPPGHAAAPPTPGESTRATPPGSRPSAWALGGLGVTELGRRVLAEVRDDDCLGRAAQLAYYFLFALFPFFLFLTTLLGYLPIPDLLDRLLDMLGGMLPGEALQLVQDNIRQLVTGQRGGLLSFGILAALWTSSSGPCQLVPYRHDRVAGRPMTA